MAKKKKKSYRRKSDAPGEEKKAKVPVTPAVISRVQAWAREAAEASTLSVYDLEITSRWLIRVYVDRPGAVEPGAGITVAECAAVSRYMEALLDTDEEVWERYTIEVSSPGVECALKEPEHFAFMQGRFAQVVLREPRGGENVFRGVIHSADDTRVTLLDNEEEIEFSYDEIAKAKLKYDFSGEANP